ncbi:hypothetical protein AB0A60_08300 [Streptomyces sp. NPDC046275]|uniref:hypothetical protein n=1 Tax=Streptomyces sp. NPDC046275 TaxID=3157201 RepID=UPI0033FECDC7
MARHDDTTPGPLPEGKRVWPRNAALALAAAGAAFLVLKLTGTAPTGGDGGAPEDEAAPSVTSAAPSATAAATPASAAARPMIPLDDVFPAAVPDGKGGRFTKVGAAVLNSCKEPGAVGPRLAALIDASKGCVGEQVALYKDGRNNQYNIAVFTMKDPVDTLHLVTELSAAFDDYQVAAQAPPAGSGLRTQRHGPVVRRRRPHDGRRPGPVVRRPHRRLPEARRPTDTPPERRHDQDRRLRARHLTASLLGAPSR